MKELLSDNGVVQTVLHMNGDEMVTQDVINGRRMQTFLDDNQKLRREGVNSKAQGRLAARIPITLYTSWRREWERKYKQDWTWKTYLATKVNNRDYSKFLTGVKQI